MKYPIITAFCLLILCTACQKKDMNALRHELDQQKDLIAQLQNTITGVNNDVKSLQAITTALQNKVSVNAYVATATGYLLTMSNGTSIELKNGINGINGTNGTNGANGTNAPLIGVKADTDGNYYWTIGNEFLLQSGQKIRVTGNNGTNGSNGTAGITPQLRVDSGTNRWMVSYDNGQTWIVVTDAAGNSIPATGATGSAGQPGTPGTSGVNNFNITDSADAIVITYNGSSYTLPKTNATIGVYKMVLVTDISLASTITLSIKAEPLDRSGVWIDLNNDEVKDPGEKINDFDGTRSYLLNGSKTITIYGKVTELYCASNQLTFLDVSNNTGLIKLSCPINQLVNLDISKNTALKTLDCSFNEITQLNCSKNTNLEVVHVFRNKIRDANMTALIHSLPDRTGKTAGVSNIVEMAMSPATNSLPTSADITTANNKNWKLYRSDGAGSLLLNP